MKLFRRPMVIHVDTHGRCNLTCPSCPRGRRPAGNGPQEFIQPSALRDMLALIDKQVRIHKLVMANWTEPALHPMLPVLIQIGQEFTPRVCVSSNLNPRADYKAIMLSEPSEMTCSCSGWSQSTYGVTHRNGSMDRFKENLAEVVRWRRGKTRVILSFHCYSHNRHERDAAMHWCMDHDVHFAPAKAKLLPLESVIDVFEGVTDNLTNDEVNVISLLDQGISVDAHESEMHRSLPCRQQDHELVLDHRGNVTLCCNLWDVQKSHVGNIFQDSIVNMQLTKKMHTTCDRCFKVGGHVYMGGGNTKFGRMRIRALDAWAKTFGRLGWTVDSRHRNAMKGN